VIIGNGGDITLFKLIFSGIVLFALIMVAYVSMVFFPKITPENAKWRLANMCYVGTTLGKMAGSTGPNHKTLNCDCVVKDIVRRKTIDETARIAEGIRKLATQKISRFFSNGKSSDPSLSSVGLSENSINNFFWNMPDVGRVCSE
jgi:hypothetical protein